MPSFNAGGTSLTTDGKTLSGSATGNSPLKLGGGTHKVYPSAAVGAIPASTGVAWTNTAAPLTQIVASTAAAGYISDLVLTVQWSPSSTRVEIDIATGAASSETVVGTFCIQSTQTGGALTTVGEIIHLLAPFNYATATRLSCRIRSDSTTVMSVVVSLNVVE